jgi:hypothetical protein
MNIEIFLSIKVTSPSGIREIITPIQPPTYLLSIVKTMKCLALTDWQLARLPIK